MSANRPAPSVAEFDEAWDEFLRMSADDAMGLVAYLSGRRPELFLEVMRVARERETHRWLDERATL